MPKMKVFLAWSGPRSMAVATALRDWLPSVIQDLDPWMSDHDIAKGVNWQTELSGQLKNVRIGIICLTPNNLNEPWINFEAGTLSKLEGSYACTYLHGLETTDVSGPLAQFQATKANKQDTKKLIQTLNEQLGESALESSRLEGTFNKWWGELEDLLKRAEDLHVQKPPKRDTDDMLREILTTLRTHSDSHTNLQHLIGDILRTTLGLTPITTLDSPGASLISSEDRQRIVAAEKSNLLLKKAKQMYRERSSQEHRRISEDGEKYE